MIEELREDPALDLVWSLWSELGIPGPRRNHRRAVVDPERLIVATSSIMSVDARLSDLVFSWCAQHAHWISGSRLSALVRTAHPELRFAAEAFLGELAAAGIVLARVPPAPAARPRDQREVSIAFGRPALLRLRMRALVGVGGRADVLVALLSAPDSWVSASSLVVEVSLAKRNIAQVLAELADGGIVQLRQRGNLHEFRLVNASALAEVVAHRDVTFPDWHSIFEWMRLAGELASLPVGRPATLRVEVARRKEVLSSLAQQLTLPPPPIVDGGDVESILLWAASCALTLADGTAGAVGGEGAHDGRTHTQNP